MNRYLLIGPIIFFIFLTGCEKQTKHRLLTFFFTGVPPLEGEKPLLDETEMVVSTRRKAPPKPTVFSHKPFKEKRCDQCHRISSAKGFGSGFALSSGGGMPGMLVAPADKLCLTCHTYLSAPASFEKGLWLHAPAAQGNCLACHRPHESQNRFLLTKKIDQICRQCHKEGLLIKTEEHLKPKACVFCHNPHLGKNPAMLKKDFEEIKTPVKPWPPEEAGVNKVS